MSVSESQGLQNTDNEQEKNNTKDSSGKRSQDLCVRATIETAVKPTSRKARKITRQMAHYLFGHMYLRDAIASARSREEWCCVNLAWLRKAKGRISTKQVDMF